MTYFSHQHAQHQRRIGDITRQLDYIYEDMIPPLMRDLTDTLGLQESADAVAALRDARKDLAQALGAMQRVQTSLPTPTRGSTLHSIERDSA